MNAPLPFEDQSDLKKFEVAAVRGLSSRPKYERAIMLAELLGEKSVELAYENKELAEMISQRLQFFGFTITKVRSRQITSDRVVKPTCREFYFGVSW